MTSLANLQAPSLDDFEALAQDAYARLPEAFRRLCEGVVIRVEDFPDRETERAMRLDSPFDLMGLYRGVALPQKSVSDPLPGVDVIFLYRRPILDYWCETGEDLEAIVRHIMIHEIGQRRRQLRHQRANPA